MSTLLAGSFELGDFENDAALSPGSTSGCGRLLHASIKDAIGVHTSLILHCASLYTIDYICAELSKLLVAHLQASTIFKT